MENLSREQLIAICDHPDIQLKFFGANWRQTVPAEEIINALLADFPKRQIFSLVKNKQ